MKYYASPNILGSQILEFEVSTPPELKCTYCKAKTFGEVFTPTKGKAIRICPDCQIKVFNKILKEEL